MILFRQPVYFPSEERTVDKQSDMSETRASENLGKKQRKRAKGTEKFAYLISCLVRRTVHSTDLPIIRRDRIRGLTMAIEPLSRFSPV